MYAIRNPGAVYHLVQAKSDLTLCGLRVISLGPSRSYQSSLHLVFSIPPKRNLCKHCERISSESPAGHLDPSPVSYTHLTLPTIYSV